MSHFGFPADTQVFKRQRKSSCFYSFSKQTVGSSAPFDNFGASLSVAFDNGLWKSASNPAQYHADISTYIAKWPKPVQEISGLNARTFKTDAANLGHSQMLLGYPVGGTYSMTLGSSPLTMGDSKAPVSPVWKVDFDKFQNLAANLNARLAAPSSTLD